MLNRQINQRALLLVLFIASILSAQSQNMEKVRHHLYKLTSKSFYGRGYIKDGGMKAAAYVSNEFESYGLRSIKGSYYQHYTLAINTFPNKVKLKVNKQQLHAGNDFVIKSSSNGAKGQSKCLYLPLSDKQKDLDLSQYFLVGNKDYKELSKVNMFGAKGFLYLQEKQPIWSVYGSKDTSSYLVFYIDENKLKDSIKTIQYKFETQYYPEFSTQNVWGIIPGKTYPDSMIIITAHYDHLGMMGKVMYPGGNDNASGTTMVLELARYFSQKEHQPDVSIMFVLFSGEEAGLLGSKYMADHFPFPNEKIRLLINVDMVATGSEGITIVNGKQFPEVFNKFVNINKEKGYLVKVNSRGESCNSDHCPFYEKGIPAIFIYTQGPEATAYHIPQDDYQSLPLTKFEDLFRLLRDYIYL